MAEAPSNDESSPSRRILQQMAAGALPYRTQLRTPWSPMMDIMGIGKDAEPYDYGKRETFAGPLDPSIKRELVDYAGNLERAKGPMSYFQLTDKAREQIKRGLPLFGMGALAYGANAFDSERREP